MVHIGSLPGAIVAFILCERIGMLWTMRQACLLWIIGSIVFITSHTLGQVFAGRFIMGLGIGQYGVIAPVYLGEVAPRQIRGMIVGMYGMSEYLGVMIGVRNSNLQYGIRSLMVSSTSPYGVPPCISPALVPGSGSFRRASKSCGQDYSYFVPFSVRRVLGFCAR